MKCVKCFSPASVLLRKKDFYCEECFLVSTNHKFRSCLGKKKMLSRDEKVLLGISRSLNSVVLLNLVHNGITIDSHKKLRIKPICTYISGLKNHRNEHDVITNLINLCQQYSLDLFVIHISQYFQKDLGSLVPNILPCMDISNDSLHSMKRVLSSTEFDDYLQKIKRSLLMRVAEETHCSHILTAETSTTLASNLLSNIALGRGYQIQHDIGFADSRHESIKILRPMRDISTEELKYYSKIKNLNPEHQLNHNEKVGSLQSLIKSFVVDLQDNYPATISTVCKTADKIGTQDDTSKTNTCQLCQSYLNVSRKTLTALEATNFSSAMCYGLVKNEVDQRLDLNMQNSTSLCYTCIQYHKKLQTST